jgi:nitrate reductase / nitrite oxidoreductase, beta subunit
MGSVFNRQLGRAMECPLQDAAKPRAYQFAAVINLNRCLGCQTCSMICKHAWTGNEGQDHMWWANVETRPFGGFPFMWDRELLSRLPDGLTVFEAALGRSAALGYLPADRDWDYANLAEDQPYGSYEVGAVGEADPAAGRYPHQWMFYLSRMCNHCRHPACVAACPTGAVYKRDDGIVAIDENRCGGARACIAACPYKKVFFNPVARKAQKCTGCFPLLEEGKQPLCFTGCPGKTRFAGNIEDESEDNPLWYLVAGPNRMALPLYPQFGLEPQVYYIPPRTVPPEFLAKMFTPDNDVELIRKIQSRYREAYTEPKLLGALMLAGATDRLIARYEVRGNDVIAYDARAVELVRVPIEEEVVVNDGPFINDL